MSLLLALSLSCTAASAHSALRRSSPPDGSTVRVAPKEIRLSFSQPVEASLSSASLKRDGETVFDTRKFEPDPKDRSTLILRCPETLPGGHYDVEWRVMSVDTHPVQGRLGFNVKP